MPFLIQFNPWATGVDQKRAAGMFEQFLSFVVQLAIVTKPNIA